jgi:sirohydrochlorin cobaltochelatase
MTNQTHAKAPDTAIVLFAHGSRDPLWHKPIQAVADFISATSKESLVTCAYLELSQPDLLVASQQLIDAGVKSISVVPVFLGVGRHAREDLPLLVDQLKTQYPLVTFRLQQAVGEDQRLIELMGKIALEGVSK